MLDLFRRFTHGSRAGVSHGELDSAYQLLDEEHGLETVYENLILHQFRKRRIPSSCVGIQVRKVGKANDGYDVFSGLVRITAWDRQAVPRLLLGLPFLEAKVRKAVRATWLADISHFSGLW